MSKLKYLTIITGIISIYLLVGFTFEVWTPLLEFPGAFDWLYILPEFIGATTLILFLIGGIVGVGGILFFLNYVLYHYLDRYVHPKQGELKDGN